MHAMARPRIDDGLTASERYERAAKRPGTPIGTRLSDAEVRAVDKARGKGTRNEKSRSAWLYALIQSAISAPNPPQAAKKHSKGDR